MRTISTPTFFAWAAITIAVMGQPSNQPSSPTGNTLNPRSASSPDVPAKWAYFKDEAKTQRLGLLTFDKGGRFQLASWNGKDVSKGKWKLKKSGAIEMVFAQPVSEAPGTMYIKGESAVWQRAIGDRYLSVVKEE